MTQTLQAETAALEMQGGKHLIFQLENRDYGIPILTVNEIIGIMKITPIPKAPEYVKGVINLRGKIILIMDLRLKFDMPEKEHNEQTCIIIVNRVLGNTTKQIGLVVDIVSEVVEIPSSEIEEPSEYITHNNCISGIGKVKDEVVMIVNVEEAVCSQEISDLLAD